MKRLIPLAAVLAAVAAAPAQAAVTVPQSCRYLGSTDRLLPFPNNAFTKADAKSPTGRRLAIPTSCAPANKDGKRMDMSEQNRLDGFSPGSQLILKVPGVVSSPALKRSKAAPITDIGASLRADAPIVILDAKTRAKQAYGAELDANEPRDADRTILVHPAKNLTPGRRYVVVVRGLRTASGRRVPAAPGVLSGIDKSARLRSLLTVARRAKVSVSRLYSIWDFTVASREALQSRMLKIRDDAFAQLGDRNLADLKPEGGVPPFQVTAIQEFTPDENPELVRRVTGTFTVPCYLTSDGCAPGGRFNLGPDGLPVQRAGSTQTARFICVIPRSSAAAPGRASLYGHGLLGDAEEATRGKHVHLMAQEHNITFCATDWSGMSTEDLPNTIAILNDLSRFNELTDRLQQGFVNFLYLGRLMRQPQGLASDPAFQVDGHPSFDTGALYFDGNSQGGIFGGSLTAIAPDYQRAVLGVPGMNYSLLLTRSSNWKTYRAIFDPAYPEAKSRPLALSLIQLLWDRADPSGWTGQMTKSPPPNTPPHEVLMQVARGDHQVAPVAADTQARSIGARTLQRPLAPGAAQDREPLHGIPRITSFPYAGSAIIYWEPGGGLARVPLQPLTKVPVKFGTDPHGDPRYTVEARRQKSAFLQPGGLVIDVCGGGPCQAEKDPARP